MVLLASVATLAIPHPGVAAADSDASILSTYTKAYNAWATYSKHPSHNLDRLYEQATLLEGKTLAAQTQMAEQTPTTETGRRLKRYATVALSDLIAVARAQEDALDAIDTPSLYRAKLNAFKRTLSVYLSAHNLVAQTSKKL